MRKVTLTKESTRDILENLLKRSPNNYGKFESAVAEILEKVKSEGDEALFTYTKQFDKVEINIVTGSVLILYRPQALRSNAELARVEQYIMNHAERRG